MPDSHANRRITLIEPRENMTRADFHAHWSGPHAEIARDLPALDWYVQNHVLEILSSETDRWSAVQGIAEIGFREPAAIFDTIDRWARVDELRQDEARFIKRRIGNWAILRDDLPQLSARRLVVILDRSADGTRIPAQTVSDVVADIRTIYPCHAMETEDHAAGQSDPLPDWFLFVELPIQSVTDPALFPDGRILQQLKQLGGTVCLVNAEAKRLPMDR